MEYVVLDLEWNQASSKWTEEEGLTFEVIEIGAVKMKENGAITDRFSRLVRPSVYRKLFEKVRQVVSITEEELNREGRPFEEVLAAFIDWCGPDCRLCTWGCMDLTELQKNIAYHGLKNPFPFPLYYLDIQKLYSLQYLDGKSRCALETAVLEQEIPQDEAFHRAVSDALYTARVLAGIDMERFGRMLSIDYFRLPQREEEEIYKIFDGYSKFVSRGYENRENAMKNKKLTGMICYRCGCNAKKKLDWFSDNSRHYYALAYCPVHGWLKGKIRTKKAVCQDAVFMVRTLKLIPHGQAMLLYAKREELNKKRKYKKDSLKK